MYHQHKILQWIHKWYHANQPNIDTISGLPPELQNVLENMMTEKERMDPDNMNKAAQAKSDQIQ